VGQRDVPNIPQFVKEARSCKYGHSACSDALPQHTGCVPNQAQVGEEETDPIQIDDATTFELGCQWRRPRDSSWRTYKDVETAAYRTKQPNTVRCKNTLLASGHRQCSPPPATATPNLPLNAATPLLLTSW